MLGVVVVWSECRVRREWSHLFLNLRGNTGRELDSNLHWLCKVIHFTRFGLVRAVDDGMNEWTLSASLITVYICGVIHSRIELTESQRFRFLYFVLLFYFFFFPFGALISLPVQIQTAEAQQVMLQQQAKHLSRLVSADSTEEQALRQAWAMLFTAKSTSQLLALSALVDEARQLGYVGLEDISLSIPENPTATQLQKVQANIAAGIIREVSQGLVVHYAEQFDGWDKSIVLVQENEYNSRTTSCWANFSISVADHPQFFKTLTQRGRANVFVPLPYPGNISFYKVNMVNMQVFPFPLVNAAPSIEVQAIQYGPSLYYDSNFRAWNYTHIPIPYAFLFEASTLCPLSQPYGNPNYVHFSPYGPWNIAISPQSMSLQNVTRLDMMFELYWNQKGSNVTPFFGRNSSPSNVGCVPPPKCAWIRFLANWTVN